MRDPEHRILDRGARESRAKLHPGARLEVTGESGGGMVKVTMTGKHEVRRVQIEPAVVGEDREMLEDLIAAAINDAVRRIESESQQLMSAAMSGMRLPPGMKMPF